MNKVSNVLIHFFKKQRFLGKIFSTIGLKQEQPEAENCFQVKKTRVHFSLSEKSKRPGTCYKTKIENQKKTERKQEKQLGKS